MREEMQEKRMEAGKKMLEKRQGKKGRRTMKDDKKK